MYTISKYGYIFIVTFLLPNISDVCSKSKNSLRPKVSIQPLILTPMIKAGKILEAQHLSQVKPLKGNINSFAGFFTVNETHNSNLFFWFFPAFEDADTAPVMVWLMGGPGSSSLISLFKENGPYKIKEDLSLELRESSWTKYHSVIYIDNPVGTGFSFTEADAGYSTNEVDIGTNLYSALVQFSTMFPQYQSNDLFITGESYAGKFVPAVSYMIHENNPSAEVKINLKGLAIGNGVIDPESMINRGEFYYQIGLVDNDGKDLFDKKEQEYVEFIQTEQWLESFLSFDSMVLGYFVELTLFYNLTGYNFIFNHLYTYDYRDFEIVSRFLSEPENNKNLHVGNLTFNGSSYLVTKYLLEDFPKSVKPWFEILLENYRVLLYNGQLDALFPYPLTDQFVAVLEWSGAAEYIAAPRVQWNVGQHLAGYAKEGGNLTYVLVRNAGHHVPLDQPDWSLDMITRFTRQEPFYL